ncbi:LysM peptidoglycan-binding domain-containing protein [Planktotalea sp.]|uniref:LysM peptidoglycan-binding domain-containing protein n=1 Tax=Planktotalea sp. TaxID=2029877 RepID=UPI003D6A828C
MSKFAFLSSGTGVTVGAGTALVGALTVAGYVGGVFFDKPTDKPTVVEAALAPVVAAPVEQADAPEAEKSVARELTEDVQKQSPSPSFDVVRVDTRGDAMIAGSAEAGSRISIRLDDEIVAEVKADARGKFASFVTLPDAADARVLTLDDGQGEPAPERVIIAPVTAARQVALSVGDDADMSTPNVDQTSFVAPVEVAARAAAPSIDAPVQAAEVEPQVKPSVQEPDEPAREPKAPAILLSTNDGVRVLQAPDAPKPDALTALLASIAYDDLGDVALTGRGEGSFVRVYLDNRPITTSQIATSGDWQADLPAVDTGIYTLRVDELNEAGDVLARIETPFKREAPEVLAAAVQPEKTVQAITVQPGATLWAIAQERYGSGTLYARVVEANRDAIRDPDLIYPGQVFTVPE